MLVIPVGLLAALGYFLYTQHAARDEVAAAPGHPAGAVVVPGATGATLVVIDRVSKAGSHRFTAVDLATGRIVATRVIDEAARCWAASPGRMWCGDADGHIHLIAVPSFASAAASEADQASRGWLGKAELGCTLEDAITVGDDHLAFGAGNPRPLTLADKPVDGGPAYDTPVFVKTSDPALVLVQHDGPLSISRLGDDPTHHEVWTAELGGDCETATTIDGKLVITTRTSARRAQVIDLATGKVAWRFAYPDHD